jgi:hypothetical protein
MIKFFINLFRSIFSFNIFKNLYNINTWKLYDTKVLSATFIFVCVSKFITYLLNKLLNLQLFLRDLIKNNSSLINAISLTLSYFYDWLPRWLKVVYYVLQLLIGSTILVYIGNEVPALFISLYSDFSFVHLFEVLHNYFYDYIVEPFISVKDFIVSLIKEARDYLFKLLDSSTTVKSMDVPSTSLPNIESVDKPIDNVSPDADPTPVDISPLPTLFEVLDVAPTVENNTPSVDNNLINPDHNHYNWVKIIGIGLLTGTIIVLIGYTLYKYNFGEIVTSVQSIPNNVAHSFGLYLNTHYYDFFELRRCWLYEIPFPPEYTNAMEHTFRIIRFEHFFNKSSSLYFF